MTHEIPWPTGMTSRRQGGLRSPVVPSTGDKADHSLFCMAGVQLKSPLTSQLNAHAPAARDAFKFSSSASEMSTSVGPEPCNVVCPSCRQQVTTRVEPKATTKTHLIALIMCLTFLWPCACCLYCTECARNSDHHCPSCNAYIGTYER